jgi:putative glutamine amidotransferase
VEIVDPSYRDRLGVDAFSTNSFHNQGVTEETLAPDLRVIALSHAGVVEALYHPDLPVLGTQWHPERASPDPLVGAELFRVWLDWCADPSRARIPKAAV